MDGFEAFDGAVVNVMGGDISGGVRFWDGSEANISCGRMRAEVLDARANKFPT